MVMWRVCSKGVDSLTVDEFLYCYKPCQIAVRFLDFKRTPEKSEAGDRPSNI